MALRTPLSVTPHLYMGDSTGRPLDMGTVYFGEQDKDPEFYPINLFSDDALTLPLAQPVHTKGGYLYDKGDMVEPHAKELIYSVKVLDSYGRKVFYKGAMMRNSWNDDVIEQINAAIVASTDIARQVATDITNEAINNTAIEGGVLTDTFLVVGGSTNQAITNKGLDSISALLGINNPSSKLRLFVKNYHAGIDGGGGEFVYDATMPKSEHNGGTVIDPNKVYPTDWTDLAQKKIWFTPDASGSGCFKRIMTDTIANDFFGTVQKTDATVELNSYFAYIRKTVVGSGYLWVKNINTTGVYNVSETIKCDFRNLTTAHFDLNITAIQPLPIIMALSVQSIMSTGYITANSGVTDPVTGESLCDIGVAVQRCIGSNMPTIRADSCRSWGVLVDTVPDLDGIGNNTGQSYFNNSQASYQRIIANNCGRKIPSTYNPAQGISGHSASISSIVSEEILSQYSGSKVKVNKLPPAVLGGETKHNFVRIGTEIYQLITINEDDSSISIFPRVPTADLGLTSVDYYMGGGVLVTGADSNVITANYMDVFNSVIGIRDASFYGLIINQYTTHNSILPWVVGASSTSVSPVGAVCNSIYTEENYKDLVHVGVGKVTIGSTNGNFTLEGCVKINTQNIFGVKTEGFRGVTFNDNNVNTFYTGQAKNWTGNTVSCSPQDGYISNHYGDSVYLIITQPSEAQNRLYGSQMKHIMCVGKSTTDGALVNPITISPYNLGAWTVNGQTAEFTMPKTIGKPSEVTIVWDWDTKNAKVFVS